MIAFGVCIGDEEIYQRWVLPTLARVMEPDSLLMAVRSSTSIFSAYNEMLDRARDQADIEALVLVHEDVELKDAHLLEKLRRALQPPDVGVVGVVGAVGVADLAWWQASGRGRCAETRGLVDFGGGDADVEAVDGLLMALSPSALRTARFDDRNYTGFHGYDVDYCFSVRQNGLRVRVADIDVFHHTKGGLGDPSSWHLSNEVFRSKWSIPTIASPVRAPEPTPSVPEAGPLSTEDVTSSLDLGGGTKSRPGWINLDPVHGTGPWRRRAQDIPWPTAEGAIQSIYSSHMMEHIPAGADRIAVMNEAWRVLRPGGTFEVRVPLFPTLPAIADPTHVSFWVPESFLYFTGTLAPDADYGIRYWEMQRSEVVDGWELRVELRKPLDPAA
jgi:hypothetical protein